MQQALYNNNNNNNNSAAYPQPEDSPQRRAEQHLRGLLAVNPDMNRKGRISPLPQAVQGAQGQISGPGGEPGIKSEFGRMFSGIGSGVGSGMGTTGSPGSSGQTPFSNSHQLRRDDLDTVAALETGPESNGQKGPQASSRGGGRRRKLKEEDNKNDDESSTGRRTPSGRGKRAKTVAHPHHHHHTPHQ